MDLVIVSSELTMFILLLHYIIFCSRFYVLYSECANIQSVEKYLNPKQSHFAKSYTVMKIFSIVLCKAK